MLHHFGVECRNGPKKADLVAGVCMVGRRVNRGRWSRSSRSLVAGGSWRIDSTNRNEVGEDTGSYCGLEGSSAMIGRGRRKPGSAVGWKLVSEIRNVFEENRV